MKYTIELKKGTVPLPEDKRLAFYSALRQIYETCLRDPDGSQQEGGSKPPAGNGESGALV